MAIWFDDGRYGCLAVHDQDRRRWCRDGGYLCACKGEVAEGAPSGRLLFSIQVTILVGGMAYELDFRDL